MIYAIYLTRYSAFCPRSVIFFRRTYDRLPSSSPVRPYTRELTRIGRGCPCRRGICTPAAFPQGFRDVFPHFLADSMLTELININDRNGHPGIHLPLPWHFSSCAVFSRCCSFLFFFSSFFPFCSSSFPFASSSPIASSSLSSPIPSRGASARLSSLFPFPARIPLFPLPVSSLLFSSADAAFFSARKKKRWEHCSCSLPPLPGVRCSVVWAVPALAGYSSSACSSGTNSLVSWVLWRAFRAASAASWQKMSWEVIFSFPLLSTFS